MRNRATTSRRAERPSWRRIGRCKKESRESRELRGTPRKGNLQVDQPTVLVISDDVEFSRSITARWQMERHVPTFTLLSGDLWPRSVDNFAVAIVGPLRRELLSVILEPLHSTQQPLFCVCHDAPTAQLVRERWPRTTVLRCDENWLNILVPAAG